MKERPAHTILLLAVFAQVISASAALARELYVAPNGSDDHPGTQTQPLATLEAARDTVHGWKRDGQWPDGGVTVWLAAGDYERSETFALTADDSGTAEGPVVWRAKANETVRLLGGRHLTGFKPVTEPAVLERLDQNARGRVQQCDLRALGLTDLGGMRSRGFGRETTPAHCELFFDSKPMTLARWPNEGAWEKIVGFPKASAKSDGHRGQLGKLSEGFTYEGDRPRRWQNTDDLWVHGYWAWDWANSYERLDTIDHAQRLVKTAPPHGLYGFRTGQRIYFLNVLEELDQPGEYYLDRKNARLYFCPPKAIASAETILSLVDQPLLRLEDVSHVSFRDLVFEATRSSAVEIRGGRGNRIANCVLRNLGNYGVKIDGGTDHGVVGCDLFDTGDGGVAMSGGDRRTLTPGGHFVENCHFQRQGRWSKCYVPAIDTKGVGQRVSHNLIHDHPHCAILFAGNDHLIEYNEIHHVAMETGDVGAIYSGRDYTFRGIRIRHNFIHHTGSAGNGGSMGVYLDDCLSGVEVFGNIFYKVQWAVFIGGGRDHLVENNMFVDCEPTLRLDGRGLDPSSPWRNNVDQGMRQSLADMPTGLYRKRYPALKRLDAYYGAPDKPAITGDDFKGVPPEHNVVARNVCVGGKWLHVSWFAEPNLLELKDNVVGSDPGFVTDARNSASDFRLKDGSAVFKTGFQPIPVEKIGLRRK